MLKISYVVCLSVLLSTQLSSFSQQAKVMFLHHSTGRMIYEGGSVNDSIEAYNLREDTDYILEERNYPYKPYVWANYPYDYWKIWLSGYCEEQRGEKGYANVQCLDDLAAKYDVVILKHCYPGADILENTGSPSVSSSRKSLENYKLQYQALREAFTQYPETHFVVWTLVPRHRLYPGATENAGRAAQFASWVRDEWLKEEGKGYPNIHVFDYFSMAAETDPEVQQPGVRYCLKYAYEKSHEDNDSHPNELACKEIGPEFYSYIIDLLEKYFGDDQDQM